MPHPDPSRLALIRKRWTDLRPVTGQQPGPNLDAVTAGLDPASQRIPINSGRVLARAHFDFGAVRRPLQTHQVEGQVLNYTSLNRPKAPKCPISESGQHDALGRWKSSGGGARPRFVRTSQDETRESAGRDSRVGYRSRLHVRVMTCRTPAVRRRALTPGVW